VPSVATSIRIPEGANSILSALSAKLGEAAEQGDEIALWEQGSGSDFKDEKG
jgi:hypothetical protein